MSLTGVAIRASLMERQRKESSERKFGMKQFFCGEVVPGCTARFEAASEDEILTQVAVHARKDHGMANIPSELVTQVRSLIRDIPNA